MGTSENDWFIPVLLILIISGAGGMILVFVVFPAYIQLNIKASNLSKSIQWKVTNYIQTVVSEFREDRRNLYQTVNSKEKEIRLLRILPKSTSPLVHAELFHACLG